MAPSLLIEFPRGGLHGRRTRFGDHTSPPPPSPSLPPARAGSWGCLGGRCRAAGADPSLFNPLLSPPPRLAPRPTQPGVPLALLPFPTLSSLPYPTLPSLPPCERPRGAERKFKSDLKLWSESHQGCSGRTAGFTASHSPVAGAVLTPRKSRKQGTACRPRVCSRCISRKLCITRSSSAEVEWCGWGKTFVLLGCS